MGLIALDCFRGTEVHKVTEFKCVSFERVDNIVAGTE